MSSGRRGKVSPQLQNFSRTTLQRVCTALKSETSFAQHRPEIFQHRSFTANKEISATFRHCIYFQLPRGNNSAATSSDSEYDLHLGIVVQRWRRLNRYSSPCYSNNLSIFIPSIHPTVEGNLLKTTKMLRLGNGPIHSNNRTSTLE